ERSLSKHVVCWRRPSVPCTPASPPRRRELVSATSPRPYRASSRPRASGWGGSSWVTASVATSTSRPRYPTSVVPARGPSSVPASSWRSSRWWLRAARACSSPTTAGRLTRRTAPWRRISSTPWPSRKTAHGCSRTGERRGRPPPAPPKQEVYMARRRRSGPRRPPRDDRQEETTQDTIRTEGVVLEARPNTTFLVQLDAGPEVLAHVGGKMRRHYIRILPG